MTVGTAKQLTAVLDSWVAQGIKEEPLGSNKTPIGEEFGWNGVAWCCETMSVAQTRIGLHCFHHAAVVDAVSDAERGVNGLEWIPANGLIREGDMSCFRWADGSHHISYVRDPGTQVKFQTDGGNEHDRMYQQWRDRKYVMGFIRLPYGAEHIDHNPPAAPALEEDDMPTIYENEENNLWFLVTGGFRFMLDPNTPDGKVTLAELRNKNPDGSARTREGGPVSTRFLVETTQPGNSIS